MAVESYKGDMVRIPFENFPNYRGLALGCRRDDDPVGLDTLVFVCVRIGRGSA
jgi:hypothetical protein